VDNTFSKYRRGLTLDLFDYKYLVEKFAKALAHYWVDQVDPLLNGGEHT